MALALMFAGPASGSGESAEPTRADMRLLRVSDSTQWLQDRREQDRKKADAARRAREKRDPLVPLYAPSTTSPAATPRPTPQNPVAPRPKS